LISDNGSGSGSGSGPASTASIPVDQQVNISVGKEVAVNGGENGNSDASGKQSSNHEDSDLQERYKTFFLSHFRIITKEGTIIACSCTFIFFFCIKFLF
jgi:hypothetical protein